MRTFSINENKELSYTTDINLMNKYLRDNIDSEDDLILCIIRGLGFKDTNISIDGFKDSIRNFIKNFYK